MNKLRKLAFGKKLYHGTSLENLVSITSAGGILPQYQPGGGTLDASNVGAFAGFVFLATTFSQARDYCQKYDYGVVIEVDISEDALLPDDDDCTTCKTWQESAEKIHQVKVSGQITSDFIRSVTIYKGYKKVVDGVSFPKWQEEFEKNKPAGSDGKETMFVNIDGYEYDNKGANSFADIEQQKKDQNNAKFMESLKSNGYQVNDGSYIKNPNIDEYIQIYNSYNQATSINVVDGYVDQLGDVYVSFKGGQSLTRRLFSFSFFSNSNQIEQYNVDFQSLQNCNADTFKSNFKNCFGDSTTFSVPYEGYLSIDEYVDYLVKEYEKRFGNNSKLASRLKKIASGITLFHCTTIKSLKAITESGQITPQASSGAGLSYDNPTSEETQNFKGYTFFATNIDKAEGYAEAIKSNDEPIVIVELKIPSDLLLPDDTDCYECKNWQESAEKVKQIKVEGPVSSSMIRKVHFYDSKTMENIKITNFNNWQNQYNNEQ